MANAAVSVAKGRDMSTHGSRTGVPGRSTRTDAGKRSIPEFFGTLPGILTALAALITAIGGAFLGGTQIAAHPQPAVTVTVRSGGGSLPAQPEASANSTSPETSGNSTSVPAGVIDLSSLTPLNYVGNAVTAASEQFGTTTYPSSVDITCVTSPVYDVAGYKEMDVTVGEPDDASGAAGESVSVQFLKDGTSQLGSATVSLDHPVSLHVVLQEASQLKITCNGPGSMVTLGDATLVPK